MILFSKRALNGILFFTFAISFFFFTQSVQAQTSEVTAIKDIWTTSVYSYAPDGCCPGGGLNDHELVVGGWGDQYYTLIEFDLNSLPARASSATLMLFPFTQRGNGTTSMRLDRITEFWDWKTQGTGTDRDRLWWADKPSAIQWNLGILPAPILNQWYSIDITDLYNAWQDSTHSNFGLQLRPVSNANRWNEFYSSDFADDPSLRPKLVVVGSAQPAKLELLDPNPALLNGVNITTNADTLPQDGRPVTGIAADGVTKTLIRIPANFVGERFNFLIKTFRNNEEFFSTSIDEDGALASMDNQTLEQSNITITAKQTSNGPMAFVIYRAPTDFPRNSADDSNSILRSVVVGASSLDVIDPVSELPISIIRPPVILVHGLWEKPSNWDTFRPLVDDLRFSIFRVDYDKKISITQSTPTYDENILKNANTNQLGFAYNAKTVLSQIRKYINRFKNSENNVGSIDVAAVQADLVVHSMGGNIARYLPLLPDFLDNDTFKQGVVHKLITIGTPHLGTPLATQLLKNNNSCVRGILAKKKKISFNNVTIESVIINGGVFDLQGDGTISGDLSSALLDIDGQFIWEFPTVMIAGVVTATQLNGLDCDVCNAELIRLICSENPLANNLTNQNWSNVVSQRSDAIVPLTSQLNGFSGIERTAIHSAGTLDLSFKGPHEYETASSIPTDTIDLLNEPITDSAFICLPDGSLWPCN